MVTKDGLYSYRTALKSMEIAGNNMFKHMKRSVTLFQAETEDFLNVYYNYFPNECRIIRLSLIHI